MPDLFRSLVCVFDRLEQHYRDMQDVEFTIENGKLWILQTRSGKRTAEAALRIAVELAEAGVISQRAAVLRVDPGSLDQLLHPTLDPDRQEATHRHGAAGIARGSCGRDRVHRRGGGGRAGARPAR